LCGATPSCGMWGTTLGWTRGDGFSCVHASRPTMDAVVSSLTGAVVHASHRAPAGSGLVGGCPCCKGTIMGGCRGLVPM